MKAPVVAAPSIDDNNNRSRHPASSTNAYNEDGGSSGAKPSQMTSAGKMEAGGSSSSQEGPPVRFGMTDPISLKLPTARDEVLTQKLEAMMRARGLYETDEGEKLRKYVLEELEKLLTEWVFEMAVERYGAEADAYLGPAGTQAVRLFTFGSYRLGVVDPNGDIDALCVVPEFVSRDAFFEYFLAKLQQDPNVTKLQPVPDAYTPIMKFNLHGVDVDLLFASLPTARVPQDLSALRDDSVLKNADEKTVRSLNGCRVAADLLSLVPDVPKFIMTLRLIKYWAKQRGIYSNVMGYLGGVSWALLVARVCQLYPYASPSQLVMKFFICYLNWDWTNPILLCPIKEYADEAGLMGFQVWNPKLNLQDRYHVMPVITPSFPSMNSTHNVTLTTRQIITGELERGKDAVSLIRKGQADWDSLVEPFDFFMSCPHFVAMEVSGANHLAYAKWHGWIESKVRLLIKRLEQYDLISVHVWPDSIPIETESREGEKSAIIFAIHVADDFEDDALDLSVPFTEFVHVLHFQWPDHGRFQSHVDLAVEQISQPALPRYILEYRRKIGFDNNDYHAPVSAGGRVSAEMSGVTADSSSSRAGCSSSSHSHESHVISQSAEATPGLPDGAPSHRTPAPLPPPVSSRPPLKDVGPASDHKASRTKRVREEFAPLEGGILPNAPDDGMQVRLLESAAHARPPYEGQPRGCERPPPPPPAAQSGGSRSRLEVCGSDSEVRDGHEGATKVRCREPRRL